VDERDTMFARMARVAGSPAYEEYYGRRPDLKRKDDHLRRMPRLCEPGGAHYHPEISLEAERWFEAIGAIEPDPAAVDERAERIAAASDPGAAVKAMARELGAVAAGATALDPAYVYSHKGRLDHDYGHAIALDHPSILVFLVEMDHGAMTRAPRAETLRESARQYYRSARIGMTIAAVLERLGYGAKPHYDAHYDVILPPLAVAAGLGEVGRNNILVSKDHGARVRIGGVSTDFPLAHDAPISLGLQRFCEVCRKCAEHCPARALSEGEREEVRGVARWPTHVERCYGYWRQMGTDCGICMAGCPFSHPATPFHDAVRAALRVMPWLARPALWLDDRFYGSRWDRYRAARPIRASAAR
jgi:reductive dehalogenase